MGTGAMAVAASVLASVQRPHAGMERVVALVTAALIVTVFQSCINHPLARIALDVVRATFAMAEDVV